ncbi:MAG: PH domain-containing protein [Candidatus Omnitrophica bacterium]|nr:PH domain-containing protein [Candidatus Omnitrophota bacterium]MDD5574907.1 PH domain-containing protein [Candidatus Omnitrophota bacterium]
MVLMLQQGEQILWEGKPEKKIYVMWLLTRVLFMSVLISGIIAYLAVVACVIYAAAHHMKAPAFYPVPSILIFVVPVVLACALFYYRHLLETFHYTVTNQRCVFQGGIFVRRRRNVPFHKITDVEINQNIIEHMLGICSLKIFTPGTGSAGVPGFEKAEIVFCGLLDAEKPASVIQDTLKKFKATGE